MATKKSTKKGKSGVSADININIDEDTMKNCKSDCDWKCKTTGSCGGCAYFLGFLGAAIYYVQTATGFWNGVWGLIKALVWPAILSYEIFKFLGI